MPDEGQPRRLKQLKAGSKSMNVQMPPKQAGLKLQGEDEPGLLNKLSRYLVGGGLLLLILGGYWYYTNSQTAVNANRGRFQTAPPVKVIAAHQRDMAVIER